MASMTSAAPSPTIDGLVDRAVPWAARTRYALDAELLARVLGLHTEWGHLSKRAWPGGCVEELLLGIWPRHGGVMPDAGRLTATMDAYWRFLRAGGLLAYGSATPTLLMGELRSALARMPSVVRVVELVDMAADVRASAFVGRCLALAAWVGEERGRPVTATGVLTLAGARTAYQDLRLAAAAGTGAPPGRDDQPSLLGPEEERRLAEQAPLAELRSAAHLPELHRLWLCCLDAGLVELADGRAYGADGPPEEDWQWCSLGNDLALSRLVGQDADRARMYLFALSPQVDLKWPPALGVRSREDGTVSRRHLTKAWWVSSWNAAGRDSAAGQRGASDREFRAALEVLTDLGVWRREGDALTGTAWGQELFTVLEPIVDPD